jgi:hypothetical protein
MLSKYSVAFYTVSVLGGIVLTQHRAVFINKHFWLAALVGLVIFLPNLIWQYTHHFPVFYHMRELRETQLQYVSPLEFLTSQLIMFLPCCFVWLAGLYYVLFSNEKRFRFVGWAYLFVMTILLIGHGKNYYALGAYPVLQAFGAYYLERITVSKTIWRYVMIVPVIHWAVYFTLPCPCTSPARLALFYQKWC